MIFSRPINQSNFFSLIGWERSQKRRLSNNVDNSGAPKFLGPFEDKYNVNEGETVFVTLKLEPGDPIPTTEQIEWIKNGSKDMSVFPR